MPAKKIKAPVDLDLAFRIAEIRRAEDAKRLLERVAGEAFRNAARALAAKYPDVAKSIHAPEGRYTTGVDHLYGDTEVYSRILYDDEGTTGVRFRIGELVRVTRRNEDEGEDMIEVVTVNRRENVTAWIPTHHAIATDVRVRE